MLATIVTVLKSGGEYSPRHVVELKRQVDLHFPGALFVVFTDQNVPGNIKQVRLEYRSWTGWFAKMEIFNPKFYGDMLYMDLDTSIVGPLDDMANIGKLTVLRDFYRDGVHKPGSGIGSGVMYLPENDRALVWARWNANPFKNMSELRMRGLGDQTFLEGIRDNEGARWIDGAARWQDELPGQVVSYKVDCNPKWKQGAVGKIPTGARVVCAHGKPKQWHADWKLEA